MICYYTLQYSILGIHLWTLNQVLSGLMKVITDTFLSDLQRAVDEKFRCVEEKEEETRRLQLLLREKERDLERQRCVLANNEETITVRTHQITRLLSPSLPRCLSGASSLCLCVCQSLEVLVRGKALELEQVCDATRNVQRQQQDSEERQSRILRERDAIISQLQAALHTRTQEAQVQTGSDVTLIYVIIINRRRKLVWIS